MTDNTTADNTTDTNAVDPQPGPVGLTKESAKADKKATRSRSKTAKSKTAKKTETTAKPSGGAKVRKRITAPARLEKLQQQWREGELPSGIAVSNSGGNFKAFEYVPEK